MRSEETTKIDIEAATESAGEVRGESPLGSGSKLLLYWWWKSLYGVGGRSGAGILGRESCEEMLRLGKERTHTDFTHRVHLEIGLEQWIVSLNIGGRR